MVKIAPSILSADFSKLGEDVKRIAEYGAEYIHIDVMDGAFVPNISFGPPVIKAVRPVTDAVFDVHLMIEHPEKYLKAFSDAGADIITVHQEACVHLHRTIQEIRALGKKPCVAINPATPICMISQVLQNVDMVLIMTVNPGFGGQKYIESVTGKIAELDKVRKEKGLCFEIQVDGGIDAETVKMASAAGSDVFVAGSAVFGAKDVKEAIYNIRKAAEEAKE